MDKYDFREDFNNDESDVTLWPHAAISPIKAHRFLLCKIPFFQALFHSSTCEASHTESKYAEAAGQIKFPEHSFAAVEAVIKFLYGHPIPNDLNQEDLKCSIYLAHMMQFRQYLESVPSSLLENVEWNELINMAYHVEVARYMEIAAQRLKRIAVAEGLKSEFLNDVLLDAYKVFRSTFIKLANDPKDTRIVHCDMIIANQYADKRAEILTSLSEYRFYFWTEIEIYRVTKLEIINNFAWFKNHLLDIADARKKRY